MSDKGWLYSEQPLHKKWKINESAFAVMGMIEDRMTPTLEIVEKILL
jgi:hypothetical protein